MAKRGARPKTIEELCQRWSKKFGPDFISDLELVKIRPYFTLSLLAKKYGVSRQALDLKFQRLFNVPVKSFSEQKRQSALKEVSGMGCRINTFVAEGSTNIKTHAYGEQKFLQRCSEHKLKVELFIHSGCNHYFVVNGKSIRLFASAVPPWNPKRNGSGYFRFAFPPVKSLKMKRSFDFYVFYIQYIDTFHIIPYEQCPARCYYVSLQVNVSPLQQERNLLYCERWDYLRSDNDIPSSNSRADLKV